MNSRDLQAKITKKKIYDIGAELLNKKEFDEISIIEICEKADVSVGTFYYYFKSKRGFLFEIYKKGDRFFEANIKPRLVSQDAIENVRIFMDSYFAFIKSDGVDLVKHLYRHDNELFTNDNRSMLNILKEVVTEGQSKNQIKTDMSPTEMVKFIFVIMRGVVFDWCIFDGHYDIVDYSKKYIDFICNSIAVDKP